MVKKMLTNVIDGRLSEIPFINHVPIFQFLYYILLFLRMIGRDRPARDCFQNQNEPHGAGGVAKYKAVV